MNVRYIEGPDRLIIDVGTRNALVTGLEPGEPVFVFRARDAFALPLIIAYARSVEPLFGEARFEQLSRDIQAVADWRRENQALLRDPD